MFEGAKILNFTLHHIISAKGVTAAKVRGRKYIRNRGYGGGFKTSVQATPPTLVGVDAPAEAEVDYGADAFTFQLTDIPDSTENLKLDIKAEYEAVHRVPNTAAPKVLMKYFFVNSKTGEKSGEMLATVKLG